MPALRSLIRSLRTGAIVCAAAGAVVGCFGRSGLDGVDLTPDGGFVGAGDGGDTASDGGSSGSGGRRGDGGSFSGSGGAIVGAGGGLFGTGGTVFGVGGSFPGSGGAVFGAGGGIFASGGSGSGGTSPTGGKAGTGGFAANGGASASGGSGAGGIGTGGKVGAGGVPASGGASSSGGKVGTGGFTASGGASSSGGSGAGGTGSGGLGAGGSAGAAGGGGVGGFTPTCSAVTCSSGCCSAAGDCVTGRADLACGASGKTCESCAATGEHCAPAGFCYTGAHCGPDDCAGCCTPNGACRAGTGRPSCGRYGALCDTCVNGEVCSDGACGDPAMTCPDSYGGCRPGSSTAPPTTSTSCTAADLATVKKACAGTTPSNACTNALTALGRSNSSCFGCLSQFLSDAAVVKCLAPFLSESCNESLTCATDCSTVTCGRCAANAKQSCQDGAFQSQGACNPYLGGYFCAAGAFGGPAAFCDATTINDTGAFLQGVGAYYCSK